MLEHDDIKLGTDDDLLISAGGDFEVDDSVIQELDILVGLNQGQLKHDPILGPGLIRLINTPVRPEKFRAILRLHLARDGKNFEELKNLIHLNKQ